MDNVKYKTKIILEYQGERHTLEMPLQDYTADDLKSAFTHLLVAATFPPSVLDDEDGGHWEWVEDVE